MPFRKISFMVNGGGAPKNINILLFLCLWGYITYSLNGTYVKKYGRRDREGGREGERREKVGAVRSCRGSLT